MKIMKKLIEHIKNIWEKWTWAQKLILFGIVAVLVIGCIVLMSELTSTSMVPIFARPITDESLLDWIVFRVEQEGYSC